MSCVHCEFPSCELCEEAKRCAYCKASLKKPRSPNEKATKKQILEACLSHEGWANQLVLHREIKQHIRFKDKPGCWIAIWGWPILLLLGMTVSAILDLNANGWDKQPSPLVPAAVLAIVLVVINQLLALRDSRRIKALQRLPTLLLIAPSQDAPCQKCGEPLVEIQSDRAYCSACKAEHIVFSDSDTVTKEELYLRIKHAKRTGHEASNQVTSVLGNGTYAKQMKEGYFRVASLQDIRRLKR